jgi:hypothetical protein
MNHESPRVFVGSSSEALATARRVQKILNSRIRATLWPDAFRPGQLLLPNLVALVDTYDFGIFVFSPDDVLISRKQRDAAVRDNVLFEIGIFMGGLGIERTFVLEVENDGHRRARVPTDLVGLLTARIRASMTEATLKNRMKKIIATITAQGPVHRTLHDEVRALRCEMEERELEVAGRSYFLIDLVREIAKSRLDPWTQLSLPNPAFAKLRRKRDTWITNEVYWWLVVLGVLRFKDIEMFSSEEGWHWTDSIGFVEWSGRGVALLNEMQ